MTTFELDRSLGYLLNRAAAGARLALEDVLRPLGLTPTQWAVLFRLHQQGEHGISAVGRSLGLDKATMSGVVARLEAAGFLGRRQPERDRRLAQLRLTAAGRRVVAEAIPLAEAVNARATRGLNEQELGELVRLLGRVTENCGQPGKDG